MSKQFIITSSNPYTGRNTTNRPLTLTEAIEYFAYTLEVGASWSHEKGNKKINKTPTTIKGLITNLNNASNNTARDGCGIYYTYTEA
jgi:hypothetical protein